MAKRKPTKRAPKVAAEPLDLDVVQLSTGEWAIVGVSAPLTEKQATEVMAAYLAVQKLLAAK
jgi:hypothetical protein